MNKKIFRIILVLTLILATSLTIFASVEEKYNPINKYNKIEKSKNGLENYKKNVNEKNQKIIDEQLNNLDVTITFSRPLSIEELKEYQDKYGLDIRQVNARVIKSDNERWTISSLASLGLDKTHDIVLNQSESVSDSIFKGYTDVYAVTNYDKLDKMMKDKLTYLVDSSAVDILDKNSNGKSLRQYPHALTWDLENLN